MAPWAKPALVSSWVLNFCSITVVGLHRLSFLQLITLQAAPDLPKRLSVLKVDDLLLSVYDSDTGRLVPRNNYNQDRQDFWLQSSTQCLSWDSWMQATYQILVREVNTSAPQAELYYMQVLKNCELDNATGIIRAITRYALNGEDVLQYQGNHNRWISVHSAAWPVTEHLNQRGGSNPVISHISPQRCTALLKATGSFIAQKTARPTARVVLVPGTQARPRCLVCHVTGFYPPSIEVTWELGGQVAQGEQLISRILPNGDPTFQIQVSIELGQEATGPAEHVCVVRHSSLGNTPLRVTWDSQHSGWPGVLGIVAGCIFAALAVGTLGLLLWKRPGVWTGMYHRVQIQPGTRICSSHN